MLFSQGLAAATAQAFGNPALFLAVVAVTVLSAGFHEFGHAAAARYGGSTPGTMGFGFYLFWPAFYTDVTDSYPLGRAGRVRTDLGGLYFNALVVLASFGVWWLTGWHAVLLLVATQILQMVRQLLPLLRFDGYHVLADLTGVPDLYQRIGPILRASLPGRWHQPEATALKTWARLVVIAWVLIVVPLMAVALLPDGARPAAAAGDGLGVAAASRPTCSAPRSATATSSASSPARWPSSPSSSRCSASATWSSGWSGGAVVGVVRRTEGRPVRRGARGVAGRGTGRRASAGPGGRPVTGTGRCAPGRAGRSSMRCRRRPAAPGWGQGSRGTAATVWPADAGPLPTEDHPVLAMVLVPAEQGVSEGTRRRAPRTRPRTPTATPRRPGSSRSTARCRPKRATTRRWR